MDILESLILYGTIDDFHAIFFAFSSSLWNITAFLMLFITLVSFFSLPFFKFFLYQNPLEYITNKNT